jgi:ubiquinone/menaquinone biosynthesis C-methylase UbiE
MNQHEMALSKVITRTFGAPRGFLGRLGGRLMTIEHAGIYRYVVDILEVDPGDRILEVGCGSGAATALVAARVTNGMAAATDPSHVMIAQARRRLRAEIAAGRAEAVQAPAEKLPFSEESFTGAFAIFTLHHWDVPEQGLREILRVLRPGGRLVIAEHVHSHDHRAHSPSEMGEDFVAESVKLLSKVGFVEVEQSEREVGKRKLVVLLARQGG